MLEKKGVAVIDLENLNSRQERNEARKKIHEGFLKNQLDAQIKKE